MAEIGGRVLVPMMGGLVLGTLGRWFNLWDLCS